MKHYRAACQAVLVLLALGAMLGCQGLSAGKQTTTPSTNTGPGQLSTNPASVSFGNVVVGQNQTQAVTLSNFGASSLTISQVTASGNSFSSSGLSLPLTLAIGQSKSLNVIFTPKSTGNSSGGLIITSNGSNPSVSVPLSGTGTSGGVQPQGTLTPNPASLNFGSVQTGKTLTVTETLTNTGTASLNISQAAMSGAGFSLSGLTLPLTLGVNQSKSFSVIFAPKSASSSSGTLSISSSGSNPTVNIGLAGSGSSSPPPVGTLIANPTSLSFGSVQVGKSATLSESLTNTGSANVNISQATVSGAGFSINGLTLPLVLTPGQSFTFNATFAPPAAGGSTGAISIASDASDPSLSIALAGTGTANGQLSVAPTSINFGNVTVGSNSQQTASLVASGTSVTVSAVNVNGSDFAVSGITFPVTIPAGQSVTFTITFTPQTTGQVSGSASFTSDASNSPTVLSLSGTGTAQQHQVDLSWMASTSQNINGYNIYRGAQHGGPYPTKVNGGALDPNTNYTDATVASGQTYYYVTTAVNSSDEESGYSNEVKAVVPSP